MRKRRISFGLLYVIVLTVTHNHKTIYHDTFAFHNTIYHDTFASNSDFNLLRNSFYRRFVNIILR